MKSTRSIAAATVVLLCWLVGQSPAATAAPLPAATVLDITMQAQQDTNWCWSAAGTTIAVFQGYSVDQNRFCALAKNTDPSQRCRNDQAHLGEVRGAFQDLGFRSPGSYLSSTITYSALQSQIAASRPVETRIGWQAGGGHMHVLYGYDTAKNWVYWGDPWGSSTRYNWATYTYYRSNSSFTWTHTLTGIQG